MISGNELIPLLVKSYPGFRDRLVDSADSWLWDTGEISLFAVFRALSPLVVENFSSGEFNGADTLFEAIERCITDGDEQVSTAATTGFLESVIGNKEIGHLAVSFMGERSRNYCRAWEKFIGASTPGL